MNLEAEGKEVGYHGGTLDMIMGRTKDSRQMVVYGYARLVAYEPSSFDLVPDILADVDVQGDRVFTFTLREGHRWSDGHPFTAEDFRYWWEDVANHEELSPTGPDSAMLVNGKAPQFRVISPTQVQFAWSVPNPSFLPALAGTRPLYIYRPAHYLKQFHADYTGETELAALVETNKQRSWAALHNKQDNLYKFDNPELPTLQPWKVDTGGASQRLVFSRNPFYHRVDPEGRQLPYIDEVVFQISDGRLIPAKSGTGERLFRRAISRSTTTPSCAKGKSATNTRPTFGVRPKVRIGALSQHERDRSGLAGVDPEREFQACPVAGDQSP